MVTRRPRVAFICDEEVKQILEEWADEEGRTVSNLVERIVLEVIASKGKMSTHTQVKERKPPKSRDIHQSRKELP
jgi:CopG-like RHH_1 or ribbon-helix-helix domain, RHH_5